jgi:dihydropteroate synthase
VGQGHPVAIMGVLNVSPESFYPGSVHLSGEAILAEAERMIDAGAALLDVGARSTAPYLPTAIGDEEEERRLAEAIALLAGRVGVPISADTCRPGPARRALEAGARILNDVSGLADPSLASLAARMRVAVILMASPGGEAPGAGPIDTIRGHLADLLERARAAGIDEERVVLDPGIGFFREGPVPWHAWDVEVLARLETLASLGRPLCVAVSRKSFLGALTGRATPAERLAGSLAATTVAVLHGASVIRTHDVRETLDAVRVAGRVREVSRPPGGVGAHG